MKFNLSLKNKEVSMEADVENIIEKGMAHKATRPAKKTRYQIKHEEKRRDAELKHKQEMEKIFVGIAFFAAILILCVLMAIFSE